MWQLVNILNALKAHIPSLRNHNLLSTLKAQNLLVNRHNYRRIHINEFPHAEGKTLRWGIAPVTLMSNDFAQALSVLPASHHKIVSCVSDQRPLAVNFARQYNVQHVFKSYEDLARCPDVDAVYISAMNALHCKLCHLMLNHDKHVLCEKQLCMTEYQVHSLITKARDRRLFLMEGMWPRCVPAYQYLRHQIMRNNLGDIYSVYCTLGMPIEPQQMTFYCGVTNDLSVYGLQLALWVYREVPELIKTSGVLNSDGIDVAANIELTFSKGRRAKIVLSAEKKLSNAAIIRGTQGHITMNNYWCPTLMVDSENTEYEFPLPLTAQPSYFHNRTGMCYEAEEVRNCVLDGRTESELFNHHESLLLANLIDTIHELLAVGIDVALEAELDEHEVDTSSLGKALTLKTHSSSTETTKVYGIH